MDLKDFVSNTIEQISRGIVQAQERCEDIGVIVNPKITIGSNGEFCIPKFHESINIQRRVQILDMDIAISVSDSQQSGTGGNIGVSILNVGGKLHSEQSESNLSRVKFIIPICLPATDVTSVE